MRLILMVVLGVTHASLSQPQRQPHGHWTVDEGENCRQFFEDFAKKANIDPLAPEDWYPITLQRVLEEKVCNKTTKNKEGGEKSKEEGGN